MTLFQEEIGILEDCENKIKGLWNELSKNGRDNGGDFLRKSISIKARPVTIKYVLTFASVTIAEI